jgi:hypothetical protein
MSWNKQKEKEAKDNFWMGFLPSFILPPIVLIIIFKTKYITSKPLFEAMYKFSKTGLMGRDVLSSTLLCFVLLFIFNKLKKERASMGCFVGAVPFIILSFWLM